MNSIAEASRGAVSPFGQLQRGGAQPFDPVHALEEFLGRRHVADLDHPALVERVDDRLVALQIGHERVEHDLGRALDQLVEDLGLGPVLGRVLELELALDGAAQRAADPTRAAPLARRRDASRAAASWRSVSRSWRSSRRTDTPLVWLTSGLVRAWKVISVISFFMNAGTKICTPSMPGDVRLLLYYGQLDLARRRIVRADLRSVPVLERRDDPAAAGVVLGVGARDDQDVERQPHRGSP